MTWVHETIREFGRQLGLQQLDLGGHGLIQLQLQSGALLAVEPVRRGEVDEILVYLIRPAGHAAQALLRKALAKAHSSQAGWMPVQVGLRGECPETQWLTLVRMPERQFTAQSLSQTVDFICRWADAVQAS